jgi:hypothetical protein
MLVQMLMRVGQYSGQLEFGMVVSLSGESTLTSTISKESSIRKKNLTIDTKNGLML